MIVDCHTHITFSDDGTGSIERSEADDKVDMSIVLGQRGADNFKANKQLGQYVAEQSKMMGFAAINPIVDKIGMRSMNAMVNDMGLKGTVLYCVADGFHPAHSRAMRFYSVAQDMRLPVFFHSATFKSDSVMEYVQPYLLDEVARQFPSLKIIVGTMGLPFIAQTLTMLAKHENVYADLTICPHRVWEIYNIVVSAFEADVMDKLLFGSGYPQAQPGDCIETLLGFNRLFADTNLPTVPREKLRSIIERDTVAVLGIS